MDAKTPAKPARSRKALNSANLEALGAARLAAILLAVAEGQMTTKRRLRMELAAQVGPGDLVAEIEKHLDTVALARGKVHWRKLKGLRQDLELFRAMIVERLAPADAAAAVLMLLRFLALERGVLARTRDTKGEVAQIFIDALDELAQVAAEAALTAPDCADVIFTALDAIRPTAAGDVTRALVPALGPEAIARLRARIETEMAPRRRISAGWRDALQALLDAQGDAAAYAATYSASESVLPPIGARIAQRFLQAGQLEAAQRALDASNPYADADGRPTTARKTPTTDPGLLAWESVRIDLLEAKGDGETAQAARWAAFERDLSPEPLRAYLRRLPDFDDVVAADRAIDHAKHFKAFTPALNFLVAWPALNEAATLVLTRASEIDGQASEILEPAARALEGRHPLAATLLLRAMILDVARFSRADLYPQARAWIVEAASLAVQISDFLDHEDHAAFDARVPIALR